MKKRLLVCLFVCVSSFAHAEFETEKKIGNWGTALMPLMEVSGVFLYDFIGRETIAGVETPVFRLTKYVDGLTFTVGAVGDLSNDGEGELRDRARQLLESGTPFVGAHIETPIFSDRVFLGAHYGRNLKEDRNILGIKSSLNFW